MSKELLAKILGLHKLAFHLTFSVELVRTVGQYLMVMINSVVIRCTSTDNLECNIFNWVPTSFPKCLELWEITKFTSNLLAATSIKNGRVTIDKVLI